jgi:hypothetical protein
MVVGWQLPVAANPLIPDPVVGRARNELRAALLQQRAAVVLLPCHTPHPTRVPSLGFKGRTTTRFEAPGSNLCQPATRELSTQVGGDVSRACEVV